MGKFYPECVVLIPADPYGLVVDNLGRKKCIFCLSIKRNKIFLCSG